MTGPSARIRLRVTAGAASSAVVGRHGDAWKVRVTAPPERGRANDAVLALLATALEIPRDRVELVAGAGARDKVLAVHGLSPAVVAERLEQTAGGAPSRRAEAVA